MARRGPHHGPGDLFPTSASRAEAQVTALADRLRAAALARQQRPPFCVYTSILHASLEQVLAEVGLAASADDQETMLASLGRIAPHPAALALARLRTRYRLAIISNTDDALIADTVAAIGTPIDHVITAQQARAYKPDHRLFLHAHVDMGVAKGETLHVGMGQFTDLKVCHELGVRSVWINRMGETLNRNWAPAAVLPDPFGTAGFADGLLDFVTGSGACALGPISKLRTLTEADDVNIQSRKVYRIKQTPPFVRRPGAGRLGSHPVYRICRGPFF